MTVKSTRISAIHQSPSRCGRIRAMAGTHDLVRLWLNGVDYGTMSRRHAQQVAEYNRLHYGEEFAITEVEDGEPVFLSQAN